MLFQATTRIAVPPALAVGRFSSFKPSTEGVQPVRQPLVTGDELQELHRRREMLRAMTPVQAFNAIEWVCANLTFSQAVAFAKQEGKLMVPNDVIGRTIKQTDPRIPSIRTGTLVIYEKAGKPFGATVIYENIEFPVPEQFGGKINCALVVEFPDFDLLHSRNNHQLVVPDENNLHLVEAFPIKDGWYEPDCEFGIPYGVVQYYSKGNEHLRRMDSSYVGPATRSGFIVYGGQGVYLFPSRQEYRWLANG